MNIWAEHIPNTTFDWNSEKNAFKRAMSKLRQFKSNATEESSLNIMVKSLDFKMLTLLPFILNTLLSIAIRIVIGDSISSTFCDTAFFDFSGMVINIRRTALTPEPAKILILGEALHRNKIRSLNRPPFLPTFGVLPLHDNDDAITFDYQHQLHLDDEVPVVADDVQDLFNEEFNEEN